MDGIARGRVPVFSIPTFHRPERLDLATEAHTTLKPSSHRLDNATQDSSHSLESMENQEFASRMAGPRGEEADDGGVEGRVSLVGAAKPKHARLAAIPARHVGTQIVLR